MNSYASEQLSRLCRFYDKKLNEIQSEEYLKEFQMHSTILHELVDRLIREEERFPTLAKINKSIMDFRREKWDQEKVERANTTREDLGRQRTNPEHAREAARIIERTLGSGGNLDREEYLAGMRQMEKCWPGSGWREAAEEMKIWFEKHPKENGRLKINPRSVFLEELDERGRRREKI